MNTSDVEVVLELEFVDLHSWHHMQRKMLADYRRHCAEQNLPVPVDMKTFEERALTHYIVSNHFAHSHEGRKSCGWTEECTIGLPLLELMLHDEINNNGAAVARGWGREMLIMHPEVLITHYIRHAKDPWAEGLRRKGFFKCVGIYSKPVGSAPDRIISRHHQRKLRRHGVEVKTSG